MFNTNKEKIYTTNRASIGFTSLGSDGGSPYTTGSPITTTLSQTPRISNSFGSTRLPSTTTTSSGSPSPMTTAPRTSRLPSTTVTGGTQSLIDFIKEVQAELGVHKKEPLLDHAKRSFDLGKFEYAPWSRSSEARAEIGNTRSTDKSKVSDVPTRESTPKVTPTRERSSVPQHTTTTRTWSVPPGEPSTTQRTEGITERSTTTMSGTPRLTGGTRIDRATRSTPEQTGTHTKLYATSSPPTGNPKIIPPTGKPGKGNWGCSAISIGVVVTV